MMVSLLSVRAPSLPRLTPLPVVAWVLPVLLLALGLGGHPAPVDAQQQVLGHEA